jgi:hypothetical protein
MAVGGAAVLFGLGERRMLPPKSRSRQGLIAHA